MTHLTETHHLAWSCKFALAALDALAVGNVDRKQRISWALDELFLVPTEGVPNKISQRIGELRKEFLVEPMEGWPGPIYRHLSKVQSWKRRDQLCREILELSIGILTAHAAFSGSTEHYSRHL